MIYEAKQRGGSTWVVFDNFRKVAVLSSISPNAKYNREVAENAAEGLNGLHDIRVSKTKKPSGLEVAWISFFNKEPNNDEEILILDDKGNIKKTTWYYSYYKADVERAKHKIWISWVKILVYLKSILP